MSERMPVGILGATGMVGQEFVTFLRDHPWFDLTWLGASDRSAGKRYSEATSWRLGGVMPSYARDIVVSESKPDGGPRQVFSPWMHPWPPASSERSLKLVTWWCRIPETIGWRKMWRCWCRRLTRNT